MMALVGTFAFEFEVSLPLLAHGAFRGSAHAYSTLLSGFGAGALIGGVYAAGRPRTGVAPLGRVAFLYAVAMMVLALAPTLWAAVGACALVGLAAILFLTTGNATVQLASDPHYRGRVMALVHRPGRQHSNRRAGRWSRLRGPRPASGDRARRSRLHCRRRRQSGPPGQASWERRSL
jgi:hypothetical protein